jgi:hypothetical protein
MAQRLYRCRKEATISSLQMKVQDLRGINEEMSKIFINLYNFALSHGLLRREPEFGQQLQSATERFMALARALSDAAQENIRDGAHKDKVEPSQRSKSKKNSHEEHKEDIGPVFKLASIDG